MKIAVTGKGGTGKTTVSAALATLFAGEGKRVILIDADPDANLQTTLGLAGSVTPLVEMSSLIEERTGAAPGAPRGIFLLNPRVDDIPERFFLKSGNILLGVMGTVRQGGSGCACPENAFLKALLRHLILDRKDVVILDMEAGIEHLGRGTASGVDWLLAITEPSAKSIETTGRIMKLASDLDIPRIGIVGNKVEGEHHSGYLREHLPERILGFVPYDASLRDADLRDSVPWEKLPRVLEAVRSIIDEMRRRV